MQRCLIEEALGQALCADDHVAWLQRFVHVGRHPRRDFRDQLADLRLLEHEAQQAAVPLPRERDFEDPNRDRSYSGWGSRERDAEVDRYEEDPSLQI